MKNQTPATAYAKLLIKTETLAAKYAEAQDGEKMTDKQGSKFQDAISIAIDKARAFYQLNSAILTEGDVSDAACDLLPSHSDLYECVLAAYGE